MHRLITGLNTLWQTFFISSQFIYAQALVIFTRENQTTGSWVSNGGCQLIHFFLWVPPTMPYQAAGEGLGFPTAGLITINFPFISIWILISCLPPWFYRTLNQVRPGSGVSLHYHIFSTNNWPAYCGLAEWCFNGNLSYYILHPADLFWC